jgi:rod shape-determining protein MreC
VPYRDSPLEDLKVPLTWTASAAVAVAVLVAASMLLSDRRDSLGPDAWGSVRQTFDRGAATVGGVVSAPVRWASDGVSFIGDYFGAVSENRRLKVRVRELERWRHTAIALKDVNERYETLLRLRTDPPLDMIAVRVVDVVGDVRGPFSNARLGNAGSEKGIKVGHPVLSEHGLIGRVVGVAPGVSRILLLTDPASRTPVMVDRTNARAILTGDGGPSPRLEFLRGVNPVREGDPILTSGDGGIFPRGVPVGVAVKGLDGVWRARLYSDRAPIDYVRVLLFDDFTQLADRQALSVTTVPPAAAAVAAPPLATVAPQPAAAAAPRPAGPVAPTPAPVRPAPAASASPPARAAAAAPRPRAAPPRPTRATAAPPTVSPAPQPYTPSSPSVPQPYRPSTTPGNAG